MNYSLSRTNPTTTFDGVEHSLIKNDNIKVFGNHFYFVMVDTKNGHKGIGAGVIVNGYYSITHSAILKPDAAIEWTSIDATSPRYPNMLSHWIISAGNFGTLGGVWVTDNLEFNSDSYIQYTDDYDVDVVQKAAEVLLG